MNIWLHHLSQPVLEALNMFFFAFHTLFTLFNMTGWIFKKTRLLHLITMGLTAFSWFVLGIFYGIGFCFFTEWHWEVLRLLGKPAASRAYIHLLVETILPIQIQEETVIAGTRWGFIFIVAATAAVWTADILKKRRRKSERD